MLSKNLRDVKARRLIAENLLLAGGKVWVGFLFNQFGNIAAQDFAPLLENQGFPVPQRPLSLARESLASFPAGHIFHATHFICDSW
jgi:hypothetical protein